MSYVPKFCAECGDEIADWNQSGYCSRTAACRRARLREVAGILPDRVRRPVERNGTHCLGCGEVLRYPSSTGYCGSNPECLKQQSALRRASYRKRCLEAYGGAVCACCGETRYYFLTLDHKDGGGNAERRIFGKGNGVYARLYTSGFPDKDKYQVLCYNCNGAKGAGPVCPCFIERNNEASK